MRTIILLLFAGYSSIAHSYSGNELLARLNSDDAYDKTHIYGYVHAILDNNFLSYEVEKFWANKENRTFLFGRFVCPPPSHNVGQAADIIKKYLETNPERRHEGAAYLSYFALLQAWPCRE